MQLDRSGEIDKGKVMSPAMEMLKKSVSDDRAQIETLMANLANAWNRHDGVAFAACFGAAADFVNVVGMHLSGRQEIEQIHVRLHQTVMRNSRLQLLSHVIRFLTETVAIAHVKWAQEGHEPPPGWNLSEVRQGLLTLVIQKESETWKIAAGHNTDIVLCASKFECD